MTRIAAVTTTLRLRAADVERDRDRLIGLFARCLPRTTDGATFDWLYRRNPHGPASVWVVLDDEHVVGAAAAFARRCVYGRETLAAQVLGDLCVVPEHRSLGPALLLQRACLAAAERAGIGLCYDFPGPAMMAVYRRLGLRPAGRLVRFVRLLRSDATIQSLVMHPRLARAISAPLNLALALRPRLSRPAPRVGLSLHEGPCDEAFSYLARRLPSRLGMHVDRTADYINWRYRENPLDRCEILTARRGSDLVAYGVFADHGDDAYLLDLVGIDDPGVLGTLLEGLADLLRQRGRRAISAPMIAAHPWREILRAHGFIARESQPIMIHVPGRHGVAGAAVPPLSLMHGDRDS